ncbi:MAG: hypothetical protein J6V72_19830 [Kiritimatiellae bacterium]|nr:hypothetical protein [Kiritimatiellia bacterium]
MNIREIENLDESTVKAMAKEAVEVKGHTMYLVDLGGYFGYSALVFADGRHIHHANGYALHHGSKKDDFECLRKWYIESMAQKLFTEDELRTPSDDYSELQAKEYYLRNYYPMKREYQTIFCSEKDAAEWYKRGKDSVVYSDIAFAYFKPCDRAFVEHLEELYKAFVACNNPLRDYAHAKEAFEHEMWNHEYAINWQADYDVISCFAKVAYKGDGSEIDQTGWTDEIKRAYRDAANHVLKKWNY